nr:hypothetical protein [Tanacetum cinerariifolium]
KRTNVNARSCRSTKVDESKYKERCRLRRPVSFGAYGDERVVRIIARAARICMDYRKLSEIAIRNCCHQMRKSCHRVYRRHLGLHEVKGGARVAFEDEFRAAEEREVLCEAQQGQSKVKRKLFGSFRNKMSNEPILALPKGSDNFVVMREARVRMHAYTKREGVRDEECDLDRSRASTTHFKLEGMNMRQRRWMKLFSDYGYETKYHMGKVNIVVDAWRRKGGVKPKRVRDICRTIQAEISEKMLVAEIGESKMIGLEMEQETPQVVVIKERLKEAKDHQERVKLIVGNQTFRI